MNLDKYPWLSDLKSDEALAAIAASREQYIRTGAVTFPQFVNPNVLSRCIEEAKSQEDGAFTTDGTHTPHLLPIDPSFPSNSVRNHEMRTQVASIAYDELPPNSALAALYQHPSLLALVAAITGKQELYLSEDPIGCCSINVFRPGYHHSFHFDESEFSTTLMLQEAEVGGTGLFQYTNPLRQTCGNEDLALEEVAAVIQKHDVSFNETDDEMKFYEAQLSSSSSSSSLSDKTPTLHTLKFEPGTLSIFSGSRSLHRVTKVEGKKSRLVAVLTFASRPGFKNSREVQELFWGRSSQ